MLTLKTKIRKDFGRKVKNLQKRGLLSGVLYGSTIKKPIPLEINLKEFEKIYKEAGESSLVTLEIEGERFLVLINEIKTEPLSGKIIHVDFYQPYLNEKIKKDKKSIDSSF
jgi:large subunit ribosomal protein L25